MIARFLTDACAEAKNAVHAYSRNPTSTNETRVAHAWREVRRMEMLLAEQRRWQREAPTPKQG